MNKTKVKIGVDAIKLTASKLINLIITLASGMLLSRFLTLEEYGTYSQLLMVVNLACSLFMLGLPNSINYFFARAENELQKSHFLSVYYTLNTLLSFITGLMLVISVPLIERLLSNYQIRYFIFFLAVFPWTRIIMSSIESVLIVSQKSNLLIIYRILNSLFLLLIILIARVLNLSFSSYLLLYLFTEILFTVWVYLILGKLSEKLKPDFDRELTKKIFYYSIPIGVATMLGTINIELGKLVISNNMGTELLAIYTNASKELPVTIIAGSVTSVLLPQITRLLQQGKKIQALKTWEDAIVLSFIVISFFAIAFFVFAPEVIMVLYSEKYLLGVDVFRVFCLVLLLRCTYFGIVLNATGKTKYIFYSSFASLALNILLSMVLIPYLGLLGPALASLISAIVMNLAQLVYTSYCTEISFSHIFPWKTIGKVLIVQGLLGGLAIISKKPIAEFFGEIMAAVFIGAIWFVIMALLFRKSIMLRWKRLNH
ncbi:MAG: oligosaccharide flippase family protein [Bacillota bacterium]|nr:oligosaccharide flippase family protein [Bacillota bacterium]